MEPLDTDLDYVAREPTAPKPGSRVNALLIFPILGALLVLLFILSAIFQIDLSDVVDTIIGLLILFFALFVVLIFWAKAPGADKRA